MSAERYTLDTNILFYAVDTSSGHRHGVAQQLVDAALNKDCVLTLQALGELYNAISRRKPEHIEAARDLISLLMSSLPLVPASPSDLVDAMWQHRSRPVHFWDALLWAAAKRHGCTTILTENLPDRWVVDGVRYMNPFLTQSTTELSEFL